MEMAEMASTLQPRECIVTKQEGKSFGFFLRIEKDTVGHLIRSVEPSSSAAKAGLKDADRVLRVNGVFVDQIEHPQVVELIKASGNSVILLVLDEAAYVNAKKKGINLENLDQNQPARPSAPAQAPAPAPARPAAPAPAPAPAPAQPPTPSPAPNKVTVSVQKPRLCYLVKDKKGYGFSLKTSQGKNGLFITALATEGSALRAGVRDNDRLVEVNGENVEKATHEQVAAKVKQSGDTVVFLVVDHETDKFYSETKTALKGEMADLKLLPLRPQIVDLKKGTDGYGFYLREQHGKKGNFIRDIDPGSPADKSSLKDRDRLVAVNGESVEALQHEEVVETIRKSGDKASLLVVDIETEKLYDMAGVCPSLYWKVEREAVKNEPVVTAASAVSKTPTPASAAPSTRLAPAPPKAPAPKTEVPHKPRLCRLVKGPTGYGFHLNAIKDMPGQFIKEVAKGGPADVGGLQDDDVLVEVNGVNVETASYEDVVMRIRGAKGNLTLLVATTEAYEFFKAHNIPVTASLAEPTADMVEPPSYTETLAAEAEKPTPEQKRRASSSSSSDESEKDKKEEDDDTKL